MRVGRQEDSHEFIRYVIEAMQQSLLFGYDSKLDSRIKETTLIHQIFGGYLRSQIKCAKCKYESNTFDPFLDLSMDLKNCDSLQKALSNFTKPEILTKGNRFKCERCVFT